MSTEPTTAKSPASVNSLATDYTRESTPSRVPEAAPTNERASSKGPSPIKQEPTAAKRAPVQAVHHEARNATNSAAFVLPTLERLKASNPNLKILDVGCGSGSITASFARLFPSSHVTGLDVNAHILPRARAVAGSLTNVTFVEGAAHELPFPAGSFDVAFCHQVLVWTPNQWEILREMLRVVSPGGVVAAREGDYATEVVWPEIPVLVDKYPRMVKGAMDAGGGSSTAGRRLVEWAMRAGVKRERVELGYGTWVYDRKEERRTWGELGSFFCPRSVLDRD